MKIQIQDWSATSSSDAPILREQLLKLKSFVRASHEASVASRPAALSDAFLSLGPFSVGLHNEVTSAAHATAIPAERPSALSIERQCAAILYVHAATLPRSPFEFTSLKDVTTPVPRVRSETLVAIEQLREFIADPESEFTRELYGLSRTGRDREAVGNTFSKVSQWIGDGRIDLVDSTLRVVQPERLSPTILVGLLSATFPIASTLTARTSFIDKVRIQLRKAHGSQKAERLLRGLA